MSADIFESNDYIQLSMWIKTVHGLRKLSVVRKTILFVRSFYPMAILRPINIQYCMDVHRLMDKTGQCSFISRFCSGINAEFS